MHKLIPKSHCLFLSEEGVGLQDLWAGRYELGSKEDCGCLILKYYSRLSWGPVKGRGKKIIHQSNGHSQVHGLLYHYYINIAHAKNARLNNYSSTNTLIHLCPTHR